VETVAISSSSSLAVRAPRDQGDQARPRGEGGAHVHFRRWPPSADGAAFGSKNGFDSAKRSRRPAPLRVPPKGAMPGQESACDFIRAAKPRRGVERPWGWKLEPASQRLPTGFPPAVRRQPHGFALRCSWSGQGRSGWARNAATAARRPRGDLALGADALRRAALTAPGRQRWLGGDSRARPQHPWQTPIHRCRAGAKSDFALWASMNSAVGGHLCQPSGFVKMQNRPSGSIFPNLRPGLHRSGRLDPWWFPRAAWGIISPGP